MLEIPLFPLNTVLFPGMPLGLYIFEERYKRMIGDCLQREQPFGVALIQQGDEALGPLAIPHAIGCTAKIAQVQHLDDGQMNIVAVGEERFRIRTLGSSSTYLVGEVEPYPLPLGDPYALESAGRRLLPFVERYLDVLSSMSEVKANTEQLPTEPLALAYLAATLLQIPVSDKQSLLASEQATELLSQVRSHYRLELPLLKAMVTQGQPVESETPFSLN